MATPSCKRSYMAASSNSITMEHREIDLVYTNTSLLWSSLVIQTSVLIPPMFMGQAQVLDTSTPSPGDTTP